MDMFLTRHVFISEQECQNALKSIKSTKSKPPFAVIKTVHNRPCLHFRTRVPNRHKVHETSSWSVLFLFQNKSAKLPQGPFVFTTPTLTPYRQQLWIDAQLVTKTEKDQESFTKKCDVTLTIEGVTDKLPDGRVIRVMVRQIIYANPWIPVHTGVGMRCPLLMDYA